MRKNRTGIRIRSFRSVRKGELGSLKIRWTQDWKNNWLQEGEMPKKNEFKKKLGKIYAKLHIRNIGCFHDSKSDTLKSLLPETQATNGHFQNYQQWPRFNGNRNYKNIRTPMFWLMVLSTKIDKACVQIFWVVLGTNDDGCWWHNGDDAVSKTK